MKSHSRFTLYVLLFTVSLLNLHPVAAAPAAPGVTGVQPGTVSNTTSTTLVITGSGFVTGSVAVLNGFGALSTAYVSDQVLTADLPPGLALGVYSLTVINPDSTSATLNNALTIVGPTATPAPTSFARPLLVVQSYGASSTSIASYQDYDFEMTLVNSGQATATNVVATFKQGDFIARATGGVRSLGSLASGQTVRFFQPLTSGGVSGNNLATLEVLVSYTDLNGTAYNETFTLTFDVYQPPSGPLATATPTPTATPRALFRPQLVVSAYRTDVVPLQPGTRFTLELDIQNVGSANAKRVTLIAGGGSASGGGGGDGTPTGPGGVSGGGGDFTNFAPVDASNVQFLGDVTSASGLTARQTFIVNASTKPAAYPMKFSFVYTDDKGASYTDDQTITLLVYQLPQVDISFYQPVEVLFTNQPNFLPLQVVNLGRSPVILGNLKVTAPNNPGAQLSNNVILVGTLELGFPFTLDANIFPDVAGPMDLVITVDYTDDFNQAQTITKTITVEVQEGFIEPIPPDGGEIPIDPNPPQEPESLWDMVLRLLKGLLGLGSERPQPTFLPTEGFPVPGEEPIIVPPQR
jgi:hypothetical protein